MEWGAEFTLVIEKGDYAEPPYDVCTDFRSRQGLRGAENYRQREKQILDDILGNFYKAVFE